MKMKNKLLFSILILSSIQVANASLCTDVYYPVCGTDGKTYTNSCKLSEAKIGINHFGTCGTKELPNIDLTSSPDKNVSNNDKEAEFDTKAAMLLDNYFAKNPKIKTLSKKIEFVNSQIKKYSRQNSVEANQLVKAFTKYKDKLVKMQTDIEEQEKKAEQDRIEEEKKKQKLLDNLGKESSNEKVIIAEDGKDAENQEDGKYITENEKDKIDTLRVRYIKDNVGVRALGGARITSFIVISKEEVEGVTYDYMIVVSEEYYKTNEGELMKGVQTAVPIILKSKIYDGKYEIVGHEEPRQGQYYEEDLKNLFPANLAKQLGEGNPFFKSKVKELQDINYKNAKIYFETN